MADTSSRTEQSKHVPTAHDILRVWRGDRCVSAGCAQRYLHSIRRFRRYCSELDLDEAAELTLDGARRFHAWYAHSRQINTTPLGAVSSPLRSLRRVYEVMGIPVPTWKSIEYRSPPATAVLRDYAAQLRQQ